MDLGQGEAVLVELRRWTRLAHPWLKVDQIAELTGCSSRQAAAAVGVLVVAGLVQATTDGGRRFRAVPDVVCRRCRLSWIDRRVEHDAACRAAMKEGRARRAKR